MLPKAMKNRKEFCDVCFKEMEINYSFLREDESAAEVWYKCSCGYKIGFAFLDKFVDMYKHQKNNFDDVPVDLNVVSEELPEIHGEK